MPNLNAANCVTAKRLFFDSQSYSETLSSLQRPADQPVLLAEQKKTDWLPKNVLARQSVCANNVFRLNRIQPKRSQWRNCEEALRRFARHPNSKRRDSQTKRNRQKVNPE